MVDYQGMVVPSAIADWAEVDTSLELSRPKLGKVWKKHILSRGKLYYSKTDEPTQEVDIDDEFLNAIKRNFDNRVYSYVQVPVVGKDNKHTEDPEKNLGEVIDLAVEDGKLYAYVDVRKEWAKKEMGSTLLGVSAMIDVNATDKRTTKKVGPALVHTVVTNNPYISDLEDYQELIAASSDTLDNVALFATSYDENNIVTDKDIIDTVAEPDAPEIEESDMPDEKPKTQDELLAELKDTYGIDVTALQELAKEVESLKAKLVENDAKPVEESVDDEASAAKDAKIAELEAKVAASSQSEALVAALTKAMQDVGVLSLSNEAPEEITVQDTVDAVVELSNDNKTLVSRIDALELTNTKLERERAEAEIDALVKEVRILPAKKESQLKLLLSNRELFYELLPEKPLLNLSGEEKGFTPTNDDADKAAASAKVASIKERYSYVFNKSANK